MRSLRDYAVLAVIVWAVVLSLGVLIILAINQPSDPRSGETAKSIALVLTERYEIMQSNVACTERADFEEFSSLVHPDDASRLARLRQERITQFRCINLIKGEYAFLQALKPGEVCLRFPLALKCVWTDAATIENARTTWYHR
jgi:hypothetical protein